MSAAIHVTFERTDGTDAVLRLEDGREVRWPLASLPGSLAEGDGVRLRLATERSDEAERDALAARVLTELLRPERARP